MRIQSMEIENFKAYVRKRFQFDDRFTLIIGDNGTGKTTILEALSVGIGGYLAGLNDVETRNIYKDEIRRGWDKPGDATITKEKQFPVRVFCQGKIDDVIYEWTRELRSTRGRTTRSDARTITDHAHELQERIVKERDHSVILPVFSYQSAGRLFSQKRNMWVDPFTTDEMSRFIGYTHCLDAESDIKLFVNWLRRMTLIQIQKRKKIGELDAVLNAIREFMKGLGHAEDGDVYFDFEEGEVVVELGGQVIPLRMMSAGYRSVIGLVADIAYRMALLNPQLRENSVKETPGIVLIDEIDLHLHPKWQWKIIEDLKRVFPKVQFIATTHAPILISSCKEGSIINLEDGVDEQESIQESSRYGWLVEDILKNVMGTLNREPHVQQKIKKIEALYYKKISNALNEEEMELLDQLVNEMVQMLPESDPVISLAQLAAIDKVVERGIHETSSENE